ncbi:MAG: hypothetical protein H6Q90_542 [Deltaproteobacteria bacterium]|nr:hypothetical protein [Deltaproteobacteria bacterium]
MQRVSELVIDDIGEPAGVLTLLALREEVDVVAGRERVAAPVLVDGDREPLIEVREVRVDPRLRERLDLVGVDERIELGVDQLLGGMAPQQRAVRGERQGLGEHGAGAVRDRDEWTVELEGDRRRGRAAPRHRAVERGERGEPVDGVRGQARLAVARGVRTAIRHVEQHLARGVRDRAATRDRRRARGIDVDIPPTGPGGRIDRDLLGHVVRDVDRGTATRSHDRDDHALARGRVGDGAHGDDLATGGEPARRRVGDHGRRQALRRDRDHDVRQRCRAHHHEAITLEREADGAALHADPGRALDEADAADRAAATELVRDQLEVSDRSAGGEHREVRGEELARRGLGDRGIAVRARGHGPAGPQAQGHIGIAIPDRLPPGEPDRVEPRGLGERHAAVFARPSARGDQRRLGSLRSHDRLTLLRKTRREQGRDSEGAQTH